jgi:hypothetical protein
MKYLAEWCLVFMLVLGICVATYGLYLDFTDDKYHLAKSDWVCEERRYLAQWTGKSYVYTPECIRYVRRP